LVALADARAFCAWMSKREGRWYGVPTEEQWEWACRAGTTTRWFFGDNMTVMPKFGWTSVNSRGRLHSVGQLLANPFGLFDIHGNASELAIDGQGRPVTRSGISGESPLRARSAKRWKINDAFYPMFRSGFRVVAEATASEAKRPPDANAPFDAAQARAHQAAWAIHSGTKVELTNPLGMKLATIPPGKFLMGSLDDEEGRNADEGPQHEVAITQPFCMGVHDVTVGQFAAFVKATGYKTEAETSGQGSYVFANDKWSNDPQADWRRPGFQQSDDNPVVCVSWNDAKAFCDWLSDKEGKKYALPTEAQWEYSCRAGSSTKAYFGEDDNAASQYVWSNHDSASKSHPVGRKKPNAWGLCDMNGNVWQWTADWYAADYYQKSSKTDPTGPRTGRTRALRGAGWGNGVPDCRSACRLLDGHRPSHRAADVGFRVVLLP
jgi:formylglycine-generating enzyme required for sulfatase activity